MNPDCYICGGEGFYYSPSLAVQKKEAELGKRKWIQKKPCAACHALYIQGKNKSIVRVVVLLLVLAGSISLCFFMFG